MMKLPGPLDTGNMALITCGLLIENHIVVTCELMQIQLRKSMVS